MPLPSHYLKQNCCNQTFLRLGFFDRSIVFVDNPAVSGVMLLFVLPRPTVELVKAEGNAFEQENRLTEGALAQLRAQFPRNTDIRHVLLKVVALNKLYSAMVRDIDVEVVAKHIVQLANDNHLDQLLDQGCLDAVFLICDCPGLKDYVSFASKFCIWHNPDAYPIYDGNVRACLSAYGKQDGFAKFRQEDLYYYKKLVEIVRAFRNYYELSCFNFKELDKFMYRSGGQILKSRKGHESQPPER